MTLTENQKIGLMKLGDVLIPGGDGFPSFSQNRCGEQIDRMLPYMNNSDRGGLLTLLTVFRFLPKFVIRAFFVLTDLHRHFPDVLGAPLRLANIGMKGVVMTLYYSDVGEGVSVHELIGWDAQVVSEEPAESEEAS